MIYSDYNLYEIAKIVGFKENKAIYHRWHITTEDQIPKFFDRTDYFTSVARYKPYLLEYMKENGGRIGGFDGSIWLDWVVLDVDEHSPAKIKIFLQYLNVNHEIPIDYNRIYFSGNKGFHILIPSTIFGLKPAVRLNEVVKKIVGRIADNVIPYDHSLYDKTQVYRMVHTKHSKTNLYKTPIDYNELDFNIEKIKDIARTMRVDFKYPAYPEDSISSLLEMAKECTQELSGKSIESNGPKSSVDNIPDRRKLCIYSMFKGTKEGKRNETAYRIASHFFRNEGYDVDIIIGILSGWNTKNSPRLTDAEIVSIATSAVTNNNDFGCNDHIMKDNCSPDCYLFRP